MLVMFIVLFGVLVVLFNDFVVMLFDFNCVLMCKIFQFQEYFFFFNLYINLEWMLWCMDLEWLMIWVMMLMIQFFGVMVSIVLLVMMVIFMLFEVCYLFYKLCFVFNNLCLYIVGLYWVLKGVIYYLVLKMLISLWIGLIVWLGLLVMGVQFVLMWGVLVFLLNYVLNIGFVIFVIFFMLQVLLFSGIYECLLVGVLFLVVYMVLGNMVELCMMGYWLGMLILVVFLLLLVWGWLLGLVGMLFLVLLISVCKIWMEIIVGGSKLVILFGLGCFKSWFFGQWCFIGQKMVNMLVMMIVMFSSDCQQNGLCQLGSQMVVVYMRIQFRFSSVYVFDSGR